MLSTKGLEHKLMLDGNVYEMITIQTHFKSVKCYWPKIILSQPNIKVTSPFQITKTQTINNNYKHNY